MAKQNVQKVKLFFCNIQRFLLKVISPKYVQLVDIDISRKMKTIIGYFGGKLGLGEEVAQLGLLG